MRCWRGPLSDKGSWLVSARRGYVDLILALMDADEDLRPQYADLYSKIAYDLTDKDKLTFNARSTLGTTTSSMRIMMQMTLIQPITMRCSGRNGVISTTSRSGQICLSSTI